VNQSARILHRSLGVFGVYSVIKLWKSLKLDDFFNITQIEKNAARLGKLGTGMAINGKSTGLLSFHSLWTKKIPFFVNQGK